jgi:hypothetical protein
VQSNKCSPTFRRSLPPPSLGQTPLKGLSVPKRLHGTTPRKQPSRGTRDHPRFYAEISPDIFSLLMYLISPTNATYLAPKNLKGESLFAPSPFLSVCLSQKTDDHPFSSVRVLTQHILSLFPCVRNTSSRFRMVTEC